ncbi:translation elongation factor P [Desulfonatronospira thiodismutans ASO3-1]|uniref:Elongation factor P n=1 Tax=Desulfonatronospira thiodismutans ASO3-1 TaxID=555779 RepID=D6SQ26_9BACT|nr:elongation factor P [Desulfonatronospira thiodismutans]EFI34852.1 translation elongation factor P [Desulfonatronospira thiodismutans ASO3-1]
MLSTTDFRKGLKIEIENEPYEIVDFMHVKPGKGGAFVRTKLRNLLTGGMLDQTFRSGEKVAKPDLESREMQYLYHDGTAYVFMDMGSYEQLMVDDESMGEKGGFLKDGQTVKALIYRGNPIDIEIPAAVILEVAETEPGMKGDTVTGGTKPARLETGIAVNVPLFINEGERIKVDTRTKEYMGRE